MIEKKSEICIVSVFGRGHWLAAQLQNAGISTVLIELSEQMGNWSPEDWEGPFGGFPTEVLGALWTQRMNEDDELVQLPHGLVFWLPEGPYEMRSMSESSRMTVAQKEKLQKLDQFYGRTFWNWRDLENFRVSSDLRVQATFAVKQATRRGITRNVEWLKSLGVHVVEKAQLMDLSSMAGKTMEALEVKVERPSLLEAHQFVWCLTSEESGMLSTQVQQKLFGKKVLESTWSWMRFRYSLSDSGTRSSLPLHFVSVQDPDLALSHENALIVQRTASQDLWDVWMLLPSEQRFNKQYLTEKAVLAKKVLSEKLPQTTVELVNYPQEYEYTYNQIGPARYPVYQGVSLSLGRIEHGWSNCFFDSPETWSSYTWEGRAPTQLAILQKIESWWKRKEEVRKKKEAKLQAKARSAKEENL
ncbi:MAG: hypothetical protein LW875_06395 [Proteobacteria bacterium]|nr:hypothetical protein [Pseudomonadota bacterium]